MNAETTPEHAGPDDDPIPLAEDRPVVDGRAKTAAEIRAEMQQLLEEDRLRAAEQAAEPAAAPRPAPSGVRDRTDEAVARIRAGGQGAAATVSRQVDRARAAVPEQAVAAVRDTVGRRPDLLAGVAGLLVLVLIVRRWRRGR